MRGPHGAWSFCRSETYRWLMARGANGLSVPDEKNIVCVHRHLDSESASAYAYKAELDA
jgi:hypothetical protein